MRGATRFFSRERQVFLVGFSLTFPRFPSKFKNRLNTSGLLNLKGIALLKSKLWLQYFKQHLKENCIVSLFVD